MIIFRFADNSPVQSQKKNVVRVTYKHQTEWLEYDLWKNGSMGSDYAARNQQIYINCRRLCLRSVPYIRMKSVLVCTQTLIHSQWSTVTKKICRFVAQFRPKGNCRYFYLIPPHFCTTRLFHSSVLVCTCCIGRDPPTSISRWSDADDPFVQSQTEKKSEQKSRKRKRKEPFRRNKKRKSKMAKQRRWHDVARTILHSIKKRREVSEKNGTNGENQKESNQTTLIFGVSGNAQANSLASLAPESSTAMKTRCTIRQQPNGIAFNRHKR